MVATSDRLNYLAQTFLSEISKIISKFFNSILYPSHFVICLGTAEYIGYYCRNKNQLLIF